jgi:predicted amino acid racemase
MNNPVLTIDTTKLKHNAQTLKTLCGGHGIEICAVTKAACADIAVAQAFLDSGISMLADSRVSNLKRLARFPVSKMMLRLPMLSEAADVVRYADISLNSELDTVRALSKAACRQKKIHGAVIMVEMGDLREGVLMDDVMPFASEGLKLPGLRLYGIGANFNCYGGVIPDAEKLSQLASLASQIERHFSVRLPIVSGGNSRSLHLLLEGSMPKGVNHLRLGESILLGRETSYGKAIEGLFSDVFKLTAEVVEIKEKPSVPYGNLGLDAFGQKPCFEDKGIMRRAIFACGRQDVLAAQLMPYPDGMEFIGASSDHMIFDVTRVQACYKVGDTIDFALPYGALVAAFTSKYINKRYL